MKVQVTAEGHPGISASTTIVFSFELEVDDSRHANSANAGRSDIRLGTDHCRFLFPVAFDLPHPDLVALAALKIISPYIGSSLKMDRPVSQEMAGAITKAYPHIKHVATDASLRPRLMPVEERPVVSFSGGVDSVAATALLGAGTPLVLSARTWHPEIGEFEKWYKTDANRETLARMPSRYDKFVVLTDFEFLSTNGKYCIYPDTYAFTIPCMLLADHLKASHIVTGDTWVAFTGDETIFNPRLTYRNNHLFQTVGLPLEPVINGVGELGSMIIADHFNLLDFATTCQYGAFQQPCMKCIKCFRKSLYSWALFGRGLSEADIDRFNASPAIRAFAEDAGRKGISFGPTYKYVFSRIPTRFDGPIGQIRSRMENLPIKPGFVDKIFGPAYQSGRVSFTNSGYKKLLPIMELMTEADISDFGMLDYRKVL